jgi:hypothetical protein
MSVEYIFSIAGVFTVAHVYLYSSSIHNQNDQRHCHHDDKMIFSSRDIAAAGAGLCVAMIAFFRVIA